MAAPSVIHIKPGSIIQSDKTFYTVLDELGEGGFGSVYKVIDGANEEFALKITKMWEFMPQERIEYAKRFRQEYEYGTSLKSNYIIKFHDFHTYEGNPFMVIELCDGGSLGDKITNGFSPDRLDKLAFEILSGLNDLHNEGIIHRDIKPDNILFDKFETPKLADFGISASVKKRHTMANFLGHAKSVFATGTYSPPEQIDPAKAMKVMGPANDIYAFGVVFYEIITRGNYPFGSFDEFVVNMPAYELKKRQEDWNKEMLYQYCPDHKWISIITKCLKFKSEDRYQTAQELIQDIGYVVKDNRPVTKVSRQSVWLLRVQNGEEIGREYNITEISKNLNKNELKIGWFNKDSPFLNDIGIAEYFTEYISNFHATLQYDSNSYYWIFKDGQYRADKYPPGWYPSTNGVLVDGNKVDDRGLPLKSNSIISIGDTTLKVMVY